MRQDSNLVLTILGTFFEFSSPVSMPGYPSAYTKPPGTPIPS